jgi:hypothetical protein
MAAGFNCDSAVEQGWDLLVKLLFGARVGDCDARAARFQKERGGDT